MPALRKQFDAELLTDAFLPNASRASFLPVATVRGGQARVPS
jgi:hypothetical protein